MSLRLTPAALITTSPLAHATRLMYTASMLPLWWYLSSTVFAAVMGFGFGYAICCSIIWFHRQAGSHPPLAPPLDTPLRWGLMFGCLMGLAMPILLLLFSMR